MEDLYKIRAPKHRRRERDWDLKLSLNPKTKKIAQNRLYLKVRKENLIVVTSLVTLPERVKYSKSLNIPPKISNY